jgi:hypothetical protein
VVYPNSRTHRPVNLSALATRQAARYAIYAFRLGKRGRMKEGACIQILTKFRRPSWM